MDCNHVQRVCPYQHQTTDGFNYSRSQPPELTSLILITLLRNMSLTIPERIKRILYLFLLNERDDNNVGVDIRQGGKNMPLMTTDVYSEAQMLLSVITW